MHVLLHSRYPENTRPRANSSRHRQLRHHRSEPGAAPSSPALQRGRSLCLPSRVPVPEPSRCLSLQLGGHPGLGPCSAPRYSAARVTGQGPSCGPLPSRVPWRLLGRGPQDEPPGPGPAPARSSPSPTDERRRGRHLGPPLSGRPAGPGRDARCGRGAPPALPAPGAGRSGARPGAASAPAAAGSSGCGGAGRWRRGRSAGGRAASK